MSNPKPRRAKSFPAAMPAPEDEDTPTPLGTFLSSFVDAPAIPHPRQLKAIESACEKITPTITSTRWREKGQELQQDKDKTTDIENKTRRTIRNTEKAIQSLTETLVRRIMLG
jgi:hypothetical protein